ncbi:MAG: hypothetical protein ACYS18_00760 [Planctomycetota bacterium]|jgi:hypothetical protein
MMAEGKKPKPKSGKKAKKILLLIILALLVLVILLFLIIPTLVSSEKGKKLILAKINSSVDGQADFGTLSMSWTKGIEATDITFDDAEGRTSLTVKQIAAKPHYTSLLTGSLSFGQTVIDQPRIEIKLKPQTPNGLQALREPSEQTDQPAAFALPIKKIDLTINDGSLKVTDRTAQITELANIDTSLKLRPPPQQTVFALNMNVLEGGKESRIAAKGNIKPENKRQWTLGKTSGELTVQIDQLNLESLAPLIALAGPEIDAKGVVSADVKSEIKSGRIQSAAAQISAQNLAITGDALKGDRLQTSELQISAKLNRQQQMMNIENLQLHIDWLKAEAQGLAPTTFDSLDEFIKSDSDLTASFELDLAKLLSQMPRTFGVKQDVDVTSGRLTADIRTLKEQQKRKITADAKLDRLAATLGTRMLVLSQPLNAQIQISSEDGHLNYDRLNFTSSFASFDCSGTNRLLEYTAELDLEKLQNEIGQFANLGQYRMAGRVLEQGKLNIEEDKITADGAATIQNLRLTSPEGLAASEKMAQIDFATSFQPKQKLVTLTSVKTTADFGRIDINNSLINWAKDTKEPLRLNASAEIDLAKLYPFAAIFASLPAEMKLEGAAKSNLNLTSKDSTYKVTTDSTSIKNLKLTSPGKEPFDQESVDMTFDVELNPLEKTIDIKEFKLTSPQIKIYKTRISQTTQSGKTKLQGQLDCEYDWAAVSSLASAFLPQDLKLYGKRTDTINFTSEYLSAHPDRLLENLSSEAKIGFEKAQYMGLDFGPTELDIQIQNGLMQIAPFSTTVNNGKLNFNASANFKQKPAMFKTQGPVQIAENIQINDQTTDKLLMYLNPVFANAVNVSGILNFNCEKLAIPLASEQKNNIEAVGTVSIEQLRLQVSDLLGQILSAIGADQPAEGMTIRPTKFALQDGYLRYDDMQMDIGETPVNFRGVIGLDKSLDMRILLPYTAEGRTVRTDRQTSEQRIALPLTGTLDKPEIDFGKLLEEQLKQQLEQKLRESLQDLF